jgi:hypothetical protein
LSGHEYACAAAGEDAATRALRSRERRMSRTTCLRP